MCGHFAVYINSASYCTPETNRMLNIIYTSINIHIYEFKKRTPE